MRAGLSRRQQYGNRLSGFAISCLAIGSFALVGCAAGKQASTAEQSPSVDGVGADSGPIAIRAAGFLPPSNGTNIAKGATATLQLVIINRSNSSQQLTGVSSSVAGGALLSSAGLPSLSPSTAVTTSTPAASGSPLISVTASGSASASSASSPAASKSGSASASPTPSAATPVTLPSPVSSPIEIPAGQLLQIGFLKSGANIVLTGLTTALFPAQTVSVTFTFGDGTTITLPLPVKQSSTGPAAPTIDIAKPEQ